MSRKLFYGLVFFAIVISVVIQCVGIHEPITEQHGFRQTQTAISVYYMLKDGYSIFYQTPVFGYPWIIPFEFPVYQSVVFLVDSILKTPLDITGRAVNLVFYYGIIIVFYQLLKELQFDRRVNFIALVAVIFSPIYLFWSRTFLIESTAFFFCLGFILFSLKYLNSKNIAYLLLAFIFSMLGCLAKITSFLPSAVFLTTIIVYRYNYKIFSVRLISYALIILISILPAIIYTKYGDAYKMQNVYSIPIASANLTAWNFGTFNQRLDIHLWGIMLKFTLLNIGYLIIPFFITWLIYIRKRGVIQFAALLAYLSSIFILFNLLSIHTYYYYSNALFGLLFIAI